MYEAWKQQDHVRLFSSWDQYPTGALVKQCHTFNDFQLFDSIAGNQECRTVSDVGCATGGFYRYFHRQWPSLGYKGFDISQLAVEHARNLYPEGNFTVFDGQLKSQADVESDIVFCRDVTHHQTNPQTFLSDLYDIAKEYLVLRVRTREIGATVFDVEQSCQYTYGRWVPYIVFNTTEIMELISSFYPSPARITIKRHPVILGGQNSRYLPKELYDPETDTAETAILIKKRKGNLAEETVTSVESCPEGISRSPWRQVIRRVARRLGV